MLLAASSSSAEGGGQNSISRQASVCHLNTASIVESKLKKKANRSKRCKSLLMLSSPFTSGSSGSTSALKSSLLSLWHPSPTATAASSSPPAGSGGSGDSHESVDCRPASGKSGGEAAAAAAAAAAATGKNSGQQPAGQAKCVKMKLFEQPLEKLFSPKAMKQLNQAANSLDTQGATGADFVQQHHQHFLAKRKRAHSASAATSPTSACLRKFTAANLPAAADNNNNNDNRPSNLNKAAAAANTRLTRAERRKLLLACLPRPIRNLLNELYLRGPSTVGIFRKSPNAKHCKELRQKLETDSQSSVEQFQVAVIASVFKEWLRSLPDCLLMSRLYPQWIDVAKLIEPLYQQQQQQPQSPDDSGCSDSTTSSVAGARVQRTSPLTDSAGNQHLLERQQLLLGPDRAHSCSAALIMSELRSINNNQGSYDTGAGQQQAAAGRRIMSALALAERHSECLRIVCQLLEALNEPNLILLRSFVCVLWHIASRADLNKMSANNLGVCVGQSLLNDEHQLGAGATASAGAAAAGHGASTLNKRHRRTRSQCILSSTLSLTNTNALNGCYLDSSGAQETAKYVPILVAFMIENAAALFGQDVTEMFSQAADNGSQEATQTITTSNKMVTTSEQIESILQHDNNNNNNKENLQESSFDHIDSSANSSLDLHSSSSGGELVANQHHPHLLMRQQILVESRFKSSQQTPDSGNPSSPAAILQSGDSNNNMQQQDSEASDSTTTSILIVNTNSNNNNNNNIGTPPPKSHQHRRQASCGGGTELQHLRPLSATESTSSSSRASSSTSGVHSESPAFSNETMSDSAHNTRSTTTTCSNSPAPSSVSSPSSASGSGSPLQERHGDEDDADSLANPTTRRSLVGSDSLLRGVNRSPSHSDASSRQLSAVSSPTGCSSIHHLGPRNSIDSASKPTQAAVELRTRHSVATLQHTSRYSTFMGVLNRVPKIPVQFTTSDYGGEAVIYNPRPRRQAPAATASAGGGGGSPTSANQCSPCLQDQTAIQMGGPASLPTHTNQTPSPLGDSVISVKPLNALQLQAQQMQQQYHTMASLSQQELRQQRINEFLAHRSSQQQHQQLVSAPSLPYMALLPSSAQQHPTYAIAAPPRLTHEHRQISAVVQQQHQAAAANYNAPTMQQHYHNSHTLNAYHHHNHHHSQLPIFYSTTNLNSMHQQQQDRYLLYHRASLNPQRSHVMSLRNYYLSLQQQQQHQSYRNTMSSVEQHQHQQQQAHKLNSQSIDHVRKANLTYRI